MKFMDSVDITTIIGCPNMCYYCPQDVFISNYKGIKVLTVDKLDLMLKNINKDKNMLNFSGYSECMRNKNIAELLLHAHNLGFIINLFTTLNGFDDNILRKLSNNIKFNYVCFHEYTGIGFNKEEFDMKVKLFVDNIEIERNYLGVANPELSYEIKKTGGSTFINTRASNNKNIKHVEYRVGKITCDFFSNNLIYHTNQILPNGDVYICCMDWSLKHKIGNIFQHHYDSDEFNENRLKIINLMNQDDSDLLCRKCEFSKKI